ncbi:DinB family protein [Chengkuizengella axinellae]|uniref:DinB family protein n=1 Tax=Chengkuizengella axinellae TaxID=3064388 RepID=A0ABT9J4S8_9BACL|nr:DinB family protein [Chengkuizengella sp. 2205SS18-9]MDP5276607.1 DinB family protein [Chengkuizengella sp. 2205SS18-9]
MTNANEVFGQTLVKSLRGERGHIPIKRALSDIDFDLAGKRIEALPYTIYQLAGHMLYWQRWFLEHLEGEQPQMPKDAMETWPSEHKPADEGAWKKIIEELLLGVDRACDFATTVQLDDPLEHWPSESKAGILRNMASHNSYHLGEIVLIRRLFGAWPPPGGGYPA